MISLLCNPQESTSIGSSGQLPGNEGQGTRQDGCRTINYLPYLSYFLCHRTVSYLQIYDNRPSEGRAGQSVWDIGTPDPRSAIRCSYGLFGAPLVRLDLIFIYSLLPLKSISVKARIYICY